MKEGFVCTQKKTITDAVLCTADVTEKCQKTPPPINVLLTNF